MIKAVIFDFYHVICSPSYWSIVEKYIPESERHAWEPIMLQADRNDISEDEFLDLLHKQSRLDVEEIRQTALANSHIYPDVVDIIKQLKKTHKIALLTNAIGYLLESIFDNNPGLRELFDEVVISSHVGKVKPEPEIYKLTLEKLGLAANETIFIDDNPNNVAGAKAVGIAGIRYLNAEQLKKDLVSQGLLND